MPELVDRQPPVAVFDEEQTRGVITIASAAAGDTEQHERRAAREPGVVVRGTLNSGPSSNSAECMPPATAAATTSGTKARTENSNNSSSMASTTAASGAPNVADMPAAAPAASRILRSDGDTGITWPSSDPIDPPVTMIGPSAPNGAPVPIAIAADTGLAMRRAGCDAALLGEHRLHRLGDAVAADHRRPLREQADQQRAADRGDEERPRRLQLVERCGARSTAGGTAPRW